MVLNPSSSFHGIKKIIKNIAWLFADCLLCWQHSQVISWFWFCPLQAGAAQLSAPHSSSNAGAAVVQGNRGTRAGRRDNILCWNNSNLVFIVSLFTAASAWHKELPAKARPCGWGITTSPLGQACLGWGIDLGAPEPSPNQGALLKLNHVNVHDGMFLTRAVSVELVPF